MNELISSFAGKRIAALGALVAAIALLAGGGAFSLGTAEAQTDDPPPLLASTGRGLDHMTAAGSTNSLSVTLTTGYRHTVCLVDDITQQTVRANSDGVAAGAPTDTDDLDWDTTSSDVDGITTAAANPATISGGVDGDVDNGVQGGVVRGPRSVLASAPTGNPPAIGWNWVITKKAGTEGSPTTANLVRRFQNDAPADSWNEGSVTVPLTEVEACVYWTSTAPGTQVIQLYQGNDLTANGARTREFEAGVTPMTLAAAAQQLEVTWVDADPAIVVHAVGNPLAITSAPIMQRMVFTGAGVAALRDADPGMADDPGTTDVNEFRAAVTAITRLVPAGSFEPASSTNVGSDSENQPATVVRTVNAFENPERSDAQLTGAKVDFAVAGTCGSVNVPGAVGTGVTGGNIGPGQTASIASWGNFINVTFSNTGMGAAACKRASSSTTLTVTAGAVSADVTVNWEWDGYGEYTVEDVNDTTKKVTFHTAVPRSYSRTGRPLGWTCDADSMARAVNFEVDGRVSVAGFARRNIVGTDGPAFASITSTSVGATTPKRTLGAGDSECQVSWTIRSPARADDVYLDISSVGVDPYSQPLSFAPEAAPTTTFDTLERPLVPGTDQVYWTGEDTAVADAVGESGAIAVYEWNRDSQSWLSWFPNSEGLGVNTLVTLRTNGIYTVVTPRN